MCALFDRFSTAHLVHSTAIQYCNYSLNTILVCLSSPHKLHGPVILVERCSVYQSRSSTRTRTLNEIRVSYERTFRNFPFVRLFVCLRKAIQFEDSTLEKLVCIHAKTPLLDKVTEADYVEELAAWGEWVMTIILAVDLTHHPSPKLMLTLVH